MTGSLEENKGRIKLRERKLERSREIRKGYNKSQIVKRTEATVDRGRGSLPICTYYDWKPLRHGSQHTVKD